MSEWTGLCGKHWGLIGDRFALLIERSVAPELLHTLSSRRSVEEIIDALVSRGIEQLPGFCLVGFDDSRVTAYLRGGFSLRVEASWHDALTETGKNVRTWREVSVAGVSRFAIVGPDEWHRADLPIRSYAADRERIVGGVQGLSLAVCEQLMTGDIPLMTTTTTQSAAPIIPEPSRPDTETSSRLLDDLFGAADPVDDATVLSPASRSEPQEANHASIGTGYALVLPDGEEIAVTAEMLLGRNPRDTDGLGATLVPVFDPGGNISRTHARISVAPEGIMVQDLGSTNGTVLVTAHDEVELAPHTSRAMKPGDSIILGGDAQLELKEHP